MQRERDAPTKYRAVAGIALAYIVVVAVACSAAPARTYRSTGGYYETSTASSGGAANDSEMPTAAGDSYGVQPPAAGSSQSRSGMPGTPPPGQYATPSPPLAVPGVSGGGGGGSAAGSIDHWLQRLDSAQSDFLGASGRCVGVCRASDGICEAAREICILTGDGGRRPALDPRCERARGQCESALRTRDQSCPVCPSGER